MTRVDALIHAVTAMLQQRRALLEDAELRGLNIEAKLERDGTVRVVLISPMYVRQTATVGLRRADI